MMKWHQTEKKRTILSIFDMTERHCECFIHLTESVGAILSHIFVTECYSNHTPESYKNWQIVRRQKKNHRKFENQ